ncbi:PTS sugar transporter subunit IIC [Mollicutes bacterium LVI A0039]|nr:PTS sugar transporter subunit IIC [Mollicutes bacterium LVI A0039]
MDKVEKFLEVKLMPVGEKLANNRYLQAIKNAFIMFSPFLIVGSVFLLASSFPIPAYQEFMTNTFGETWSMVVEIPFNAAYSFMAIFLTFLVGYNFAIIEDVDPVSSGLLSAIVFFILTPLTDAGDLGTVLSLKWLGSNGIFVGFLAAFTTVNIFKQFIRRDFVIKMPEQVPPEVARSFSAIIPATTIMILALIVRMVFSITEFGTIHAFIFGVIAIPVGRFGTSFFGSLLYSIALTLLWSVGINSGSMINGILRPFWLTNQTENIEALKAGAEQLPHVITEQFFDMIWMGGSGVTLGLLIAMILTSKSRQNKAISKLAFAPGLFNINEPVLFGLPVILNPIMLIPFNLVPLVMITTQYIAMNIGLVARPTGVIIPWTTPPVISGFLITSSITGALMQIVNLLIAALIYYPFVRIVDKQNFAEEQGEQHE